VRSLRAQDVVDRVAIPGYDPADSRPGLYFYTSPPTSRTHSSVPHTACARSCTTQPSMAGRCIGKTFARRPAAATDRPVALDPSGGGPRATSIFSVTLSDARDRRRTLAEPPNLRVAAGRRAGRLTVREWVICVRAHADPGSLHGYGCSGLSAWWRRAKIAAWTRSWRSSLVRMLRTWVLTVCSPMARSRAIWRLL
jgi:hypothetical protein